MIPTIPALTFLTTCRKIYRLTTQNKKKSPWSTDGYSHFYILMKIWSFQSKVSATPCIDLLGLSSLMYDSFQNDKYFDSEQTGLQYRVLVSPIKTFKVPSKFWNHMAPL